MYSTNSLIYLIYSHSPRASEVKQTIVGEGMFSNALMPSWSPAYRHPHFAHVQNPTQPLIGCIDDSGASAY